MANMNNINEVWRVKRSVLTEEMFHSHMSLKCDTWFQHYTIEQREWKTVSGLPFASYKHTAHWAFCVVITDH